MVDLCRPLCIIETIICTGSLHVVQKNKKTLHVYTLYEAIIHKVRTWLTVSDPLCILPVVNYKDDNLARRSSQRSGMVSSLSSTPGKSMTSRPSITPSKL